MVEPLRDPAMFRRAFLSFGVPTWPNGFDLDAINLHTEMAARRAREAGGGGVEASEAGRKLRGFLDN